MPNSFTLTSRRASPLTLLEGEVIVLTGAGHAQITGPVNRTVRTSATPVGVGPFTKVAVVTVTPEDSVTVDRYDLSSPIAFADLPTPQAVPAGTLAFVYDRFSGTHYYRNFAGEWVTSLTADDGLSYDPVTGTLTVTVLSAGSANMASTGSFGCGGAGAKANAFFTGYAINASILMRRANGTEEAPTALLIDQNIGVVGARGYGATGFSASSRANIRFVTAENWTDTAHGTYMSFNTTLAGTTSSNERMRITDAGEIIITTLGKGLSIKEGSNARMGTATLVGGTLTVNTTAVTANSRIFLTCQTPGGTPGFLYVSARSASTSFTITSGSGTDTSTVAWLIVEPAA
jgi:hypothetical protein